MSDDKSETDRQGLEEAILYAKKYIEDMLPAAMMTRLLNCMFLAHTSTAF